MLPRPVTSESLGMKILHQPSDEKSIEVDIVAIHGIGADPDDTWCKRTKSKEQPGVNWLSDEKMLPSAVPKARIMRYGYMSAWFGNEAIQQNVTRVADSFLRSLQRMRKAPSCAKRPLLLIAHCFGGLVVLKALLKAERWPEDWVNIYPNVAGIAFFGTPFRGAEQEGQRELITAVERMHQDTVLADVLRITRAGDEVLLGIVDDFMSIRERTGRQIELTCFYELMPTNLMGVVGERGRKTLRVDENSGCLDGAERIGLQRSHFNMNKFADPEEEEYQDVVDVLTKMVKAGSDLLTSGDQPNVASTTQSNPRHPSPATQDPKKKKRRNGQKQGPRVLKVAGLRISGVSGNVDVQQNVAGRDMVFGPQK